MALVAPPGLTLVFVGPRGATLVRQLGIKLLLLGRARDQAPPPHQSKVSGRVKGDERHGDWVRGSRAERERERV